MKTHYEVLGVTPEIGRSGLRRAYLDSARRHHPDAGGDAAEMLAVNDAWSVLSDPRRRAVYDLFIGARRHAESASTTKHVSFDEDEVHDEGRDRRDLEHDARAFRRGRSSLVETLSLLAVMVLGGAAGVSLLFGMVLTMGELVGLGVFLAFLTGVSVLARLLLAMRSTAQ